VYPEERRGAPPDCARGATPPQTGCVQHPRGALPGTILKHPGTNTFIILEEKRTPNSDEVAMADLVLASFPCYPTP